MLEDNIHINTQSSIQIGNMFFDPINTGSIKSIAKYIFITHTHYDHFNIKDMKNVMDSNTVIIAPTSAKGELEYNFFKNKIIFTKPNDTLNFNDIKVETIPAYNTNKLYHTKDKNWLGYKVTKNGTSYYVTGDTDATPEMLKVTCDVLLLPVGGTFTMNANEAANAANTIKPKLAIPTHYGSIVGNKEDGTNFKNALNNNIMCKLFI